MLTSSIFSGSADLAVIEAGGRQMLAPEISDSVALVQQALLAVGMELPDNGVDGAFGNQTGNAVSSFKADRHVLPSDPIVGPGTTRRLDLEVTYLDAQTFNPAFDAKTLALA